MRLSHIREVVVCPKAKLLNPSWVTYEPKLQLRVKRLSFIHANQLASSLTLL